MVLESIFGERTVRKHPLFILFMTIAVSIGSLILAYVLFPKHASVLSIAFITIGLVPLIHRILIKEETEEATSRKSCTTFFARHFNVIMVFVWVFIGVIISFAIAYIALPPEINQELFSEQINTFCILTGKCDGMVPGSVGQFAAAANNVCRNSETRNLAACSFFIFENNAGVLAFIIVLSLFYGAGAIFIIAWNASVLGIFFGEMIASGAIEYGLGMFQSLLVGHGPPELLGYVFGAFAGAILSAMVARGKIFTHEFSIIVKDFFFLAGIAFFSIFYGAVMEASIMTLNDQLIYYGMGFFYLVILIILVMVYRNKRC